MSEAQVFDQAVSKMQIGDYHALRVLLIQYPKLVHRRDETNASLLLKLFELSNDSPNIAKLARVLLVAGSSVNAQSNKRSPVPLLSALQAKQLEVVQTLLEFGANLRTKAHPRPGTVLDYAIELCQEHKDDKTFSSKLRGLIQAYTGGKLS